MVREKELRLAEIWPWSAGEGLDESAKRSRSLRMLVDSRRAELKSAFCMGVSTCLRWAEECGGQTMLVDGLRL